MVVLNVQDRSGSISSNQRLAMMLPQPPGGRPMGLLPIPELTGLPGGICCCVYTAASGSRQASLSSEGGATKAPVRGIKAFWQGIDRPSANHYPVSSFSDETSHLVGCASSLCPLVMNMGGGGGPQGPQTTPCCITSCHSKEALKTQKLETFMQKGRALTLPFLHESFGSVQVKGSQVGFCMRREMPG